ncbi:hypothetical protein CC86DRAFT_367933 [Ophiobolus disseminans]|uniref:Uncharacterized protein n=1 Tax=Ophiobolus disseminans TaxID=1469910 RepID=A0A6A7ABT6_9PLEO|nr:hypothetical protein CC86DRAFT_367933 [Ophiobolus disseminans]
MLDLMLFAEALLMLGVGAARLDFAGGLSRALGVGASVRRPGDVSLLTGFAGGLNRTPLGVGIHCTILVNAKCVGVVRVATIVLIENLNDLGKHTYAPPGVDKATHVSMSKERGLYVVVYSKGAGSTLISRDDDEIEANDPASNM